MLSDRIIQASTPVGTIRGATTSFPISLSVYPEPRLVFWSRQQTIHRPGRLVQPEVARAANPRWLRPFRAVLGLLSSMRHRLLVFAMLCGSWPAIATGQVILNEQFLRELQDNGLTFSETTLKDYTIAPIIENPHMDYELAVRSKRIPLEIRYAVRRYDQLSKKGSVPVESMPKPTFEVVLLNVARGDDKKSDILSAVEFKTEDVKKEFNADWGASALLVPKKEFSSAFDRCMVVSISRKRSSAFIFYLFNNTNKDAALNELNDVFHVLRFR